MHNLNYFNVPYETVRIKTVPKVTVKELSEHTVGVSIHSNCPQGEGKDRTLSFEPDEKNPVPFILTHIIKS